jgi:hypothetical protein
MKADENLQSAMQPASEIRLLKEEEIRAVSGGFLVLLVIAALALAGCATTGLPPVQHPSK